MTDRNFQLANDESRERLARLAARLTPTDLGADLGEGWTVASALAHTGFWDRWQAERWTQMLAGKWTAQDESVLAAEHLANEALHPYWAGIDSSDIAALAVEAAAHLDRLIASAPDALVDALEGTPSAYMLHRHRHRGDHIDHIERVLAERDRSLTGRESVADGAYVERNSASLARLRGFIGKLEAADLARPVGDGTWTVGQVLGHLSFWDRFLAGRWRAALAIGPAEQPEYMSHTIADILNESLPAAWAGFASKAGRAAMDETLAAAEEINGVIAHLPADCPTGAILAERPALLDRSIHRSEHLAALEAAVVKGGR